MKLFTNNSFMIFIFSLIVLIPPNEMDYFFNLEESVFARILPNILH